VRVTLAVPVDTDRRDAARDRLRSALERLRAAGIEAHGSVTDDGDPLHAVLDVYDPTRHDEIVVSTLPAHLSRWLGCDVPQRVEKATGALVRVVESRTAPAAMRR
jgi:GABA permease